MLFNIYYINTPKVYEISMMINNYLIKSVQQENTSAIENTTSINADLSLGYLDQIKTNLGSSESEKLSQSKKIVENIEVITTKSILLRNIIAKVRNVKNFEGINEGDLIRVDGIKLELNNETELRQVKTLNNGALKGFTYEGLEISNLVNSMLKDYSYVLTGSVNSSKIIVKIPIQIENEFENLYNIDDLLLGSVSIIGIYKEKIDKSKIRNTFSAMIESGDQKPRNILIDRSDKDVESAKANIEEAEKYHFIDTIAIIQEIYKNSEIIQTKKQCMIIRFVKYLCSCFARR